MDVRVYWLWLVLVFGPAEQRIWSLGKDMDSASAFCEALRSGRISDLTVPEKERVSSVPFGKAEEIISGCESKGVSVLCYESEGYPEKLKAIPNPPAVIFVKGDLGFIGDSFTVCVAGSRSPSEYSRRITSAIVRELCENGCIIASGLAEGIDTLAADIASDCGYPTLGIYGLSIDGFAPGENADSSEEGALISEVHSEMNFPRPKFTNRNRLITALCDAVIFVEGSLTSKGLDICARCIAQGRLLFAVPPHDITDPRYMGQSWLIRRGCKPFFSVKDVLFELSRMGVERLEYTGDTEEYTDMEDYSFFVGEVPGGKKEKTSAKTSRREHSEETENAPSEERPEPDLSALDEKEKEIVLLLKDGSMLADEISVRVDLDITETLSMLTMLELGGYVISLPGKRFGTP